jgi:hypothetical protein
VLYQNKPISISHLSFSDILKKFNPSLQGFSKGQGFLQNNGFNMAVPGAMAL